MGQELNHCLKVLVTPSVRRAVGQAARRSGRSLSAWCREAVEARLTEVMTRTGRKAR